MKSTTRENVMHNWKVIQLVMVTGLLILMLGLSANLPAKAEKGSDSASEWFKVADNTYVFRYRFYFTLFVKTENGIVAFDPISNEAAEHYAKAIREAAPGAKLKTIVYTHWHTDHSTGAKVLRREFGSNIPIIAHENTYNRLKGLTDSDVPLPTKMVTNDGLVLKDDNNPIELKYLGYAHTDTMLIAYLPKQKLVFGVDFVNHDSMGWRDLPGVDIDELISMQKRLMKIDFKTITFGHGRPGGRQVVSRQINYYETLLKEATSAVNKGLSEDQAAKSIVMDKYKNWQNYDNWFTMNVRGAYRFVKEKAG